MVLRYFDFKRIFSYKHVPIILKYNMFTTCLKIKISWKTESKFCMLKVCKKETIFYRNVACVDPFKYKTLDFILIKIIMGEDKNFTCKSG